MKRKNSFTKVGAGWSIVFIIMAAAVVCAFSFLVVLPIWFFAEHFRLGYTIIVCVILCGAILYGCYKSLKKKADKQGFGKAVFTFFLYLGCFAAAVYTLFHVNRWIAITLMIVPFIISGIFKSKRNVKIT